MPTARPGHLMRHPAESWLEVQKSCNNAVMAMLSEALAGQNYISLITFRKDGTAVPTPLWFAESGGKLFVMTRGDSFKTRRIRNNASVRVAPCTMRGRVISEYLDATATILPESDWPAARRLLEQKYWLMRLSFLWSKKNVFLVIEDAAS